MDYAAWKLFTEAAELGSLSKVAVAYGTSQPHISRQISELEHECGGRLFQRTGRGVLLTELGQRMRMAVSILRFSIERVRHPGMVILTWSRHQPILSEPRGIGWLSGRRDHFHA